MSQSDCAPQFTYQQYQKKIAATKELLMDHARCAKDAQEIANKHDHMVHKLSQELDEMQVPVPQKDFNEDEGAEMSGKKTSKASQYLLTGEDVVRPQKPDSPVFSNRGMLFQHELRDFGIEFENLSLDPARGAEEVARTQKEDSTKVSSQSEEVQIIKPANTPSKNNFLDSLLSEPQSTGYPEKSTTTSTPTAQCIAVPRGLGMFQAATVNKLSLSLEGSPEVFLNVYEVAELSKGWHDLLTTFGTGAYHSGVEVYGREWSFGQSPAFDSPTGVDMLKMPKNHPAHRYLETVSLGPTRLSPEEVQALIQGLEREWLAVDYNALRRNCVTFSETLCTRLGVKAPPEKVGALTRGLKVFLFA